MEILLKDKLRVKKIWQTSFKSKTSTHKLRKAKVKTKKKKHHKKSWRQYRLYSCKTTFHFTLKKKKAGDKLEESNLFGRTSKKCH